MHRGAPRCMGDLCICQTPSDFHFSTGDPKMQQEFDATGRFNDLTMRAIDQCVKVSLDLTSLPAH
ncbi:hypothetical protein [Candidatus Hakubella thermalkaliphila]|uniref:Uncharacterized protein n=1 Tax=Candidatus Hakubella thermalkaliphila TaxID=2754717 RepID=A0A6V8PFC6_9ACTN|nr:hypothetical protein [Candidatus Hakubella thermalkaliphila]GFP31033.1 hypothetical protein HKBW3S34_01952 [Candidatus Hakubella thermalkaliphila]GFP39672.1 hypothetical protein HKBW3S47_01370 [Candidatus Hakubella thermalkaliphila]